MATEEEFDKEFSWFEALTGAHREMLEKLSTFLGEGPIENPKPPPSFRSLRSSRTSGSRSSTRSVEEKIQEKARKVAETELRMKQAQEEARVREIEEERIRRFDEETLLKKDPN